MHDGEQTVAAAGDSVSVLLILSVLLIAGLMGGYIAKRLHMPGLTGNMLAGILIGPACLDLFSGVNLSELLQPLSTFAMGLIAVSVGSHLSYRRIHNALRRIITICFFEVIFVVGLVTWVAIKLGAEWPTAFVLGCIASETAPATTMAIIRETRAKGPFVKTLLTVVALDNMLCIVLFAFARMIMLDYYESGDNSVAFGGALLHVCWQLGASVALALVLGYFTERFVHSSKSHDFSVIFVTILLSVSVSGAFGLSPLLTSLFVGVYLGNASQEASRQTQALEPIELLLFICFFTLAGASLHLDMMIAAKWLCLAYLLARLLGKSLGAWLGGMAAKVPRTLAANMSISLIPEAGVGIGLVVLLSGDPRIPGEASELVATLVLGAVVINEIIGPFTTRRALNNVKETNKDRRRLIEFLQEEYILTNLEAKDKWEALEKLTDFFIRTHGTFASSRKELLSSIVEREKEFSTGVGHSAAIPHGRIEKGSGIRGVLAICPKGIDFEAIDGKPVRILMLVVTPKGNEKEHLEVMASLAMMLSDEAIRTRLLAAINPYDAWEVIESEDTRNYNYFLEGPEESDKPA